MSKILTITVPSYNTERYMDECLPTMLSSELFANIEILLVNDGSKDNTLAKAREFEVKYPDVIKVIDKENGGHGSAINTGIKHATGKYFKVIDGDDWVNTDKFIDFVNRLDLYDVDQIISPYEDHNVDTGIVTEQSFKNVEDGKVYQYDEFLEMIGKLPMMHATTFKTSILKDNGIKIDENSFYVDMEYIIFPMAYISTVAYLDLPVYCYRMGTAEQSINPENFIKNRAMHRNVTIQLTKSYVELKKKYPQQYRTKILGNQLSYVEFCLDMNIHLLMDEPKTAKKELGIYIKTLKHIDKNLISSVREKRYKLLIWNNSLFFNIVRNRVKRKNMNIR